jgi:hypothetical protein
MLSIASVLSITYVIDIIVIDNRSSQMKCPHCGKTFNFRLAKDDIDHILRSPRGDTELARETGIDRTTIARIRKNKKTTKTTG